MSPAASSTAASRACATASSRRDESRCDRPPGDCATLPERDRRPCSPRGGPGRRSRPRCGAAGARRRAPHRRRGGAHAASRRCWPSSRTTRARSPRASRSTTASSTRAPASRAARSCASSTRETGARPRGPSRCPAQLFGEGITVVGDRIWQLTWRDGVVLEWDRATLTLRRQVPIDGEGWGLCHRRHAAGAQRRHGPPALPGPRHLRRAGLGHGDARRRAGHRSSTSWSASTGRCGRTCGRPTGSCASTRPTGASRPSWTPPGCSTRAAAPAPTCSTASRRCRATDEFLVTGKLWPTTFRVRFAP